MHATGGASTVNRLLLAGVLGLLGVASCSLALDANAPQCTKTSDCLARGAAFADAICVDARCVAKPPVAALSAAEAGPPIVAPDGAPDPWRCAGKVSWPSLPPDPIVVRETITNYIDERPVPGLTVQVCGRSDVDCTSPLAMVTTDATGTANVPITKGFTGYLLMKTPPATFPDLMPTIEPLIYPPGLDPSLLTTTMIAVSRSALSALGASVGATLDPSRGVLAGTLTDCDNKPAAGVVFDVEQADEQTSSYYFQNGLPSVGRTATDEGGTAGFVNVPAGLVTVTTKLERTNQRIGSRTLLVRPGTLTAFSLPPTPL